VELARVFQLRTRLDEAEVLLREAYDAFLEIGSSRPSNVRSVAKDLALLYMRTGRVEESRELLEELLEFESELLAPAHPDIQRTRLYLGQLYFLISRFEDTERMYLDGLAAARALDGPPDSFSLSFATDLARIYNRTQRHEKAEPHARNALEWARVKVSDQSLEMLLALLELGISLGRQGKLDEAEAPLLESYQLAVGSYPTVQSRLIAAGELLRLYRAQGRAADAERFAEILAPWGETDFLQSR
jgi:tetratricopeptide (TPR) repeat protein